MKKYKDWYLPDQEEAFIHYFESLNVIEYQRAKSKFL